jgi:hypothetical protein
MDAVVYQIVEKAAVSDVALEKAMSCHVWKAHSRSLLVLVSADSPSLLVLLSMVLMVLVLLSAVVLAVVKVLSMVVQACL